MEFEWERVDANVGHNSTYRAKIFGGWLVRFRCWDEDANTDSLSMVFVPDPHHEWGMDIMEGVI